MGVDAPDISPIIEFFFIFTNKLLSNSEESSILYVFEQTFLAISKSFAVFALCFPPTTKTKSDSFAKLYESSCLFIVSAHIVL